MALGILAHWVFCHVTKFTSVINPSQSNHSVANCFLSAQDDQDDFFIYDGQVPFEFSIMQNMVTIRPRYGQHFFETQFVSIIS